jgi:hypothetical protein
MFFSGVDWELPTLLDYRPAVKQRGQTEDEIVASAIVIRES